MLFLPKRTLKLVLRFDRERAKPQQPILCNDEVLALHPYQSQLKSSKGNTSVTVAITVDHSS